MNQVQTPSPASQRSPSAFSARTTTVLVILLLLAGAAMRLYKFPAVPVGLHWDEMSEAYESAALLKTGGDRWAYHLPVYFLGWGSGQNVLQAYLTMPVIAVFGLTKLSARFIPMLCGLLAMPLFYLTLRRWYGETAALIGLLFLAFSPWEIMLSRWGIENSPLPFFMILSVYCFGRALDSRSSWLIAFSLLPFALSCYVYGVAVVIVPVFLCLLFLVGKRQILTHRRAWMGAVALCFFAAAPLAFFTVKNYVLKKNFSFERYLPFTVPLLPQTRLGQVRREQPSENTQLHNLRFLLHGFSDQKTEPAIYQPWYQIPGVLPIQSVVLLFALAGMGFQVRRMMQERNFNEPFLPWLLSCLPLVVLFPLNISRANPFFLPVIALGASGAASTFSALHKDSARIALAAVSLLAFFIPVGFFAHDYFGSVYAKDINDIFRPRFPQALAAVRNLAGNAMPIYIDQEIQINYVPVLFYSDTDPSVFQAAHTTYDHPDFGLYRFSRKTLNQSSGPFAFLVDTEPPPCPNPIDTSRFDHLLVGRCPGTPSKP